MKNDYKKQLEKNSVIAFVPGGDSMWPTLKDRSQSVVIKKKTERLKKFDVALFMRDGVKYVLHRVIDVLPDGYVFLGDSQVNPEKVEEENVIGVMIGFNRGKKYIDVENEKYKKEVEKLFGNDKRRKRKVRMFYIRKGIKNRIKKLFGKPEKEEKDD